MSEWRPIETAPKDGTWFLATNKAWSIGSIGSPPSCWMLCRWDGTEWEAGPERITTLNGKWIEDPTHWMPLPEPPAEKE